MTTHCGAFAKLQKRSDGALSNAAYHEKTTISLRESQTSQVSFSLAMLERYVLVFVLDHKIKELGTTLVVG